MPVYYGPLRSRVRLCFLMMKNVYIGLVYSCVVFLACVVISILWSLLNVQASKVRLEVYMETHCPDVKAFFTHHLIPTYKQVGEVMDIRIHPYGNANEYPLGMGDDLHYKFECQHGTEECQGNMLLACAKNYFSEQDFLQFIFCYIAEDDKTTAPQVCSSRLLLPLTAVLNCAQTSEGQRLLHQEGEVQRELQPPLRGVPWVVIGIHDSQYDSSFLYDRKNYKVLPNLKLLICDTYEGELPDGCSEMFQFRHY